MGDNENFSSDFTADFNPSEAGSGVDFSWAKRLNTTGSTCDAYVTELKHRKVFVKRLKEQYRNSARHRAAFEKEYEIGVGLSHPALPVYIDFQGDYIVMNYIDGRTLANMMATEDEWLTDGKNAVKVIEQLLEVLEYLHRKGVIHCDIKSDNVLLTYAGNNVALVDLDKVYTSHLADTSGSAIKYGLEESDKRNTDIDFAGLGLIAGQLAEKVKSAAVKKRIARFSKECKKPGVTAEELKSILLVGSSSAREAKRGRKNDVGRRYYRLLILIFIGCLAIVFIGIFVKLRNEQPVSVSTELVPVITDSVPGKIKDIPVAETTAETSAPVGPTVSQKAQQSAKLDRELTAHFRPLLEYVENTMRRYENGELDEAQQRQAVTIITERYLDLLHDSYGLCRDLYPDISPSEAQLKVADSPVFNSLTKKVEEATRRLSGRIPD